MRKIWILAILVVLAIGIFWAGAYFLPIPLGEPSLRVKLEPQNQPWVLMSGGRLQVNITIGNDAWLWAAAKNVRVVIQAPENFSISGSSTNQYNVYLSVLRGGEEQTSAFNLTASYAIFSGIYDMTVKVTADDAPQQLLTTQIKVTQYIIIP
jgi:hypothetical protein